MSTEVDEQGVKRTYHIILEGKPYLDHYQSAGVEWDMLSDSKPEECEGLIGKTVAKVEASEYDFTVTFTDGSSLHLYGGRWDGASLGVDIELKEGQE